MPYPDFFLYYSVSVSIMLYLTFQLKVKSINGDPDSFTNEILPHKAKFCLFKDNIIKF